MSSGPKNADAFSHASKMLAVHLGASVDQKIERYTHTIKIDDTAEFEMYPSNVEHFPLGLGINTYSRDGGLASQVMVGLFTDFSFALGAIEHVRALHNEADDELMGETHLVTVQEIKVGDLIEDLGFTVSKMKWEGGVLVLGDGDKLIYLPEGYEVKVVRGWPGYSDFIESNKSDLDFCVEAWIAEDFLRCAGSETAAVAVYRIAKDIFALADGIDLRSEYDLIDDQFDRLKNDAK